MTRGLAAVAAASIAVLGIANVATADSSRSAKTYKASLTAVNPAATAAGVPDVAGRAQLVDGKKRNKVSLHMRNLAPNTMYLWHVHEGSCPVAGPPVAGWTYRTQTGPNGTLTANESGHANTRGRSDTFNADPAKRYSVNVHTATGTVIACGDLKANKASGKGKPKKPHPPHPPQAKGPKA